MLPVPLIMQVSLLLQASVLPPLLLLLLLFQSS
jgi:hypothetical protein